MTSITPTYGRLDLRGDRWVLSDVPPHVAIREGIALPVFGRGEFKAFVYGIEFRKEGHAHSGMIRYVGKALDPERRFRRHMNPKDNYGYVQRSVSKHGPECFSLTYLAEARGDSKIEAEKLALQHEVRLIAYHNTALGKHGLNLTRGGEGTSLVGEAAERKRTASGKMLNEIKKRPEVQEKLRQIAVEKAERSRQTGVPLPMHTPAAHHSRAATMRRKYREDPEFRANRLACLDVARASPAGRAAQVEHGKRLIAYAKEPETTNACCGK